MELMGQSERIFRGTGISSGKACGILRFFRKAPPPRARAGQVLDSEAERLRLETALRTTGEQLAVLRGRALSEAGKEEAEIFEIHAMLLEDEDFLDTLWQELEKGRCAEDAVERATRMFSQQLRELNDSYLSARAADISDVAERVERVLAGEDGLERLRETEPHILVAEDLTPSETVLLDKSLILGFVTFAGAPNSHTSILARAMGIPALVRVGELPDRYDSAYALLDAAAGTLTVSPTEEQIVAFRSQQAADSRRTREREQYLQTLIGKPAVTAGGHRMLIYANVGDGAEVEPALRGGADGIGLLRSEFLYLAFRDYPTEEQLLEAYRGIVSRMQGKRVIIRTLDIGADKKIDYFDLPEEENPALGFRAVRLCLSREALFKTQLRAILRASAYGNVAVMIPMIVSADEVRKCRQLFDACKAELKREGKAFHTDMELGIMVETPAAAIMSDEISAEVDFFSVGTNDLTQYTLAADRQNPFLAELCAQNTEPVLRLIETAANAIHRRGGWIGICGELAADTRLTQRFADMKIDELSVSVPHLPEVREAVLHCK